MNPGDTMYMYTKTILRLFESLSPLDFQTMLKLKLLSSTTGVDLLLSFLSYLGDPMGNQGGNKVMGLPTEGLSAAQCGTCSDNGSEAQGLFNVTASSSDVSLVETSASNVQPSEARSEAQNNIVLSAAREQSAKRALIENVEDSLPEQSPLPFEKRSFMWEPIESMKVICAMPQRPHFRPLEQYCKSFREGIAIGLMVTFSNVVNSIGKLEIADPHHKFDGILKSLLPLEVYGFDVQRVRACLMELLRMKDNHDQLVDKRSALKRLIVKEKRVKELLNVEIESIEKTSKGLEQSISHLYEGEHNIFKRERENNSKLGILEIDSSRIEDALLSARHDFEAICSSMW